MNKYARLKVIDDALIDVMERQIVILEEWVAERDTEIVRLRAIIENGLGPEDLEQDSLQSQV